MKVRFWKQNSYVNIAITKVFLILGLIFTIIGIFFIIFSGGFLAYNEHVKKTYIKTEATIVDIDNRFDENEIMYVSYNVNYNGRTYADEHRKINFYSSFYSINDKIIIHINPNTGYVCHVSYIIVFVFFGLGLVFLPLGSTFLIIRHKKISRKKRFMRIGKKIYARVVDLCENCKIIYNERHPYKLRCEYYQEYSDQTFVFISDNVFIDDEVDYLGKYVAIYVLDLKTFDKYYVDASELKRECEEY